MHIPDDMMGTKKEKNSIKPLIADLDKEIGNYIFMRLLGFGFDDQLTF